MRTGNKGSMYSRTSLVWSQVGSRIMSCEEKGDMHVGNRDISHLFTGLTQLKSPPGGGVGRHAGGRGRASPVYRLNVISKTLG